jgi:hypothetical protein
MRFIRWLGFLCLLSAGCRSSPSATGCDLDMARAICGACNLAWCEDGGLIGCTQVACLTPPDGGPP